MLFYYTLFMAGVFISVAAQVLLKRSSMNHNNGFRDEYLNKSVITGYFLFFSSALCIILAYREIPFKYGQILNSFGFIVLTYLSNRIFGEKITKNKIIGIIFIMLGIIVFFI